MNITKELAGKIATEITNPIKVEMEKIDTEISEIVCSDYLKSVPDEVLKVSKKHYQYFNDNNSQFLYTGTGLGNCGTYIAGDIPRDERGTYRDYFKVSDSSAKRIVKLLNNKKNLREKLDRMIEQTKSILLSLRTYKKIQTEFPEAAKYLPEKTTTTLAIPIENLRKEIIKLGDV